MQLIDHANNVTQHTYYVADDTDPYTSKKYGTILNTEYANGNLWLITGNNRLIRQSMTDVSPVGTTGVLFKSNSYDNFTAPGSLNSFKNLAGIRADSNGDIWTTDENGTNGANRILCYRVKEKIWDQYIINKTSFSGKIYDIEISDDGRVYLATDKGLKHVSTKCLSSASSLLTKNPTPKSESGNILEYETYERRIDFSNMVVSDEATYNFYNDEACTDMISGHTVEVQMTEEGSTLKTVWLKVLAENGQDFTKYRINIRRYAVTLRIAPLVERTYYYGETYVPKWYVQNPEDFLDSDTEECLSNITFNPYIFINESYYTGSMEGWSIYR